MVRIRDEEATLYESVQSLRELTIPHEILLILHLCKDRSAEIAEQLRSENPRVKVYTYDQPISRAGYETLATPANSKHSLPSYNIWCFGRATFPWVFKWDADFIASPALLAFLNGRNWISENIGFRINAVNSTSKNGEVYLTSGQIGYAKCLFWEVPICAYGREERIVDEAVVIQHKSDLVDLKSYWLERPWYEMEDSGEARLVAERVRRLVAEFGEEPKGMARASNPECDRIFIRLCQSPSYKSEYSSW